MEALMEKLRKRPPESWAGESIVVVKDYMDRNTDLPRSNVLQFITVEDTIVTVRPSGTEPKIKFYASCRAKPQEPLADAKRRVGEALERIGEQIDALL